MNSGELRKKFIEYFVTKGHKEIPGASLVPENDPSVLFTTAGMQQFKRYYTNPDEAPADNVVSVQPCFRTSDIDEVGDDTHLTFFEMLGNFSFNGYEKADAIKYAWELLTEILKIDANRITATYYDHTKASGPMSILFEKTDEESYKELSKYLDQSKIQSQGDDNFWTLGSVDSPGGPTVEFYVDDIEIWNLVFNEAIYKGDHWHWPKPDQILGIDTGMGLERLLVVLNNQNIYETDLFQPIIEKIEEISGLKEAPLGGKKYQDHEKEFRIISDHIKAATFAINDGILPSNKEQGYIVRRLIRRAVRRAKSIGIEKNQLYKIVEVVINIYKNIYKELENHKEEIIKQLNKEEEIFQKPLDWVEQYRIDLEEAKKNKIIKKIKNIPILSAPNIASGRYVYENYQTYGVPYDMSKEIVEELKIDFDDNGFNEAFKAHQEKSKTADAGIFRGGLVSGGKQETKYHSATHLLLASLREVLGDKVYQRGSNINAERLRFDFSYPEKLTDEQIKKVEEIVNENIKNDLEVTMQEMTLDEAKKSGAMGIFENKYGASVKVYSIGSGANIISHEICGGPHVNSTSELGHFKIIREESSSSGVRRIKAVLR